MKIIKRLFDSRSDKGNKSTQIDSGNANRRDVKNDTSNISLVISDVERQVVVLRKEINVALYTALKKSFEELEREIGYENLHGFAIGVGSFFEYCRGMACSKEWVSSDAPYLESKSIFVEWPYYVEFEIFDEVLTKCKQIYLIKDKMLESLDYCTEADAYDNEERNLTFNSMIQTFKQFKVDEGLSDDILLIIGNEDGGSDERLIRTISELNTVKNTDIALKDFGIR